MDALDWSHDKTGVYNAEDWNRIESWTAYLAAQLRGYGYAVVITPRAAQPGTPQPQAVEYIESSGTQYIDTGFNPNQDTRVVLDVQVLDNMTGPGHFGSAIGTYFFALFFDDSVSGWYGSRFGSSAVQNFPSALNTRNRITIDKNGNSTTIGETTITATDINFQMTLNLPLFCRNSSGKMDNFIKSRLFSCKIYNNSVLVRDYLPYYDANGVACLYDTANDSFAYNAGSGVFTASEPFIVPSHTDWTRADFPTRSEVDRIRRNVDALQAGFYSLPDWREIVYNSKLDFGQANALEWDLQRLYDWLRAMVSSFQMRQANTIFMQAGGILNA